MWLPGIVQANACCRCFWLLLLLLRRERSRRASGLKFSFERKEVWHESFFVVFASYQKKYIGISTKGMFSNTKTRNEVSIRQKKGCRALHSGWGGGSPKFQVLSRSNHHHGPRTGCSASFLVVPPPAPPPASWPRGGARGTGTLRLAWTAPAPAGTRDRSGTAGAGGGGGRRAAPGRRRRGGRRPWRNFGGSWSVIYPS